ncbi:MAG: pyruvate kinase [Gemmatimonadales bacterium]|jgi:pyruvate kinase
MNRQDESFPKTKIVCTIGPASRDVGTLQALCGAGMDVARLNMSHSSPDEVRAAARMLRESAGSSDRPLALLVDLQGPKIRLGHLPESVKIESGAQVVLSPAADATHDELPVTYDELADDLAAGDRVLLNDGRIELCVSHVRPPKVVCEAITGGEVTSGKGINLPGVRIGAPALTDKDMNDIELALEIEADYLALSFVRSAENVRELRRRVPDDTLIMSKIEKDVALEELESILEASDAVMVARGDLGTELPFEQVPLIQKRIVRRANDLHRPVIIATEMLESMIERPRPTRAEVSDVANAILDGTDAVMLSAETAIGKHPVDSVRALSRVIRAVESSGSQVVGTPPYDVAASLEEIGPMSTEAAVALATKEAVRAVHAPAVLSFTRSGFTARLVSSRRPPVPIVAVTDSERVRRQLALVWGVLPVVSDGDPSYDEMWRLGRAEIMKRGLAAPGDRIVVTAGMPFHVQGTTNMVRIETI